ncbi:MAG: EF-hand domain-containing protein [Planctomycetaceae bacterium]|nr:EF-hand domain-containing protein [Planctomycetaceae bacterium]
MNIFSNRLKIVTLSVIAVCTLLLPKTAVFADEQGDLFAKLDKNKNDVLEASEIGPAQKTLFERLLRQGDANKDGKISLQEFRQATTPEPKQSLEEKLRQNQRGANTRKKNTFNPEQIFRFLDTNKNGKITRAELPERARQRFGQLFDKLNKEEITKAEFLKSMKNMRPQPGFAGAGNPQQFFKRIDKNKDQKITLDEVPQNLRPYFQRIFKQAKKSPQEGLTKEDLQKFGRKPQAGKPNN